VWPLHESLSFAQGAAIGVPYATAYRSLFFKAHARPGETLLVHGASGAVGVAAVQMAHNYGMTVIGTAGTQEGLDLVKQQGADHVFNHRDKGYEQLILVCVCARTHARSTFAGGNWWPWRECRTRDGSGEESEPGPFDASPVRTDCCNRLPWPDQFPTGTNNR
jgi:hypothetical protein